MAQHARLKIDAGIQVYFCDRHSPWQRGTNENTNGLLRQYFPKGTDLGMHSADDIAAVAAALNSRPRKSLLGKRRPKRLTNHLYRPCQATSGTVSGRGVIVISDVTGKDPRSRSHSLVGSKDHSSEPTCLRQNAARRSCPGCRLRHRRAATARPGRDRARRYARPGWATSTVGNCAAEWRASGDTRRWKKIVEIGAGLSQ